MKIKQKEAGIGPFFKNKKAIKVTEIGRYVLL